MTLRHLFTVLLLYPIILTASAAYDTSNPNMYPNLDGTTWVGTDFGGKKYEITFHAEDYAHRAAAPSQGVRAGTASFVTNPDQRIKTFLYYFEGPAQQNHHDPDYAYHIRFECPDTWVMFRGTLLDGKIHLDWVEPRTTAIDPQLLFGQNFASDPGSKGGGIVKDGDQEVSYQIEYYGEIEKSERTIESELENGGTTELGPPNLGDCSFYTHAPGQPPVAPSLSFVRDNVVVHVQAHNPTDSSNATKSILNIAYKLDSAIHEGNPAVTVLSMPKTLELKQ